MPRQEQAELSEQEIKTLMARALRIVDRELSPPDHVPARVLEFLQPLVDATCQGHYSTLMMVLGTMAALTNGAQVKLWAQKPTPLVACVFQVGNAQSGKSRLFSVCEEMLDECDDVIADQVDLMVGNIDSQGAGTPTGMPPVTTKSITLQSVTLTEFFYRCSSEFPLVEFADGDPRAKVGSSKAVWFGRACNLDEAYEFFEGLGMLSAASSGKDKSPSVYASTLNTLIACGKTRRATRTSASFGAVRGKTVSVSVLGNTHPSKFIIMERGMLGNHTACTKERFTVCLDYAAAFHSALSRHGGEGSDGSNWSWLPLTRQQAEVFGWERLLDSPSVAVEEGLREDCSIVNTEEDGAHGAIIEGPSNGYIIDLPDGVESRLRFRRTRSADVAAEVFTTEFRISARWKQASPSEHIRAAARRVAELFASKPHSELQFEDDARKVLLGNQVAQNIKAKQCDSDVQLAALHANAAGQQGVFAALMAVLDYAAGEERLSAGLPVVTREHVQSARRLVDISVAIRAMWRCPLDGSAGTGGDNHDQPPSDMSSIARPVAGNYLSPQLDAPAATQQRVPLLAAAAPLEPAEHRTDAAWPLGSEAELQAVGEEEAPEAIPPTDLPTPLQYGDIPDLAEFDTRGLGADSAFIFASTQLSSGPVQVFKDREFVRRVMLTGRSRASISSLVDNYAIGVDDGQRDSNKKKRRVRPGRQDAIAVLKAAFAQYPRLGSYSERNSEVILKAWSPSMHNQIQYHNELMQCCHVSLSELSQRRARLSDAGPANIAHACGEGVGSAAGVPLAANHDHIVRPAELVAAPLHVRQEADDAVERGAMSDGPAAVLTGSRPASSTPPGGIEA